MDGWLCIYSEGQNGHDEIRILKLSLTMNVKVKK